MAGNLYTGWDFARIGTATVDLTDTSGGPFTINFSSSTYAHVDLQSVLGSGNYDDFGTAVKTAFDAAGRTYTVTYTTSTRKYNIAVDSGNFSLTFPATAAGTRLKQILGYTGNKSGATNYTSDVAVYYVVPLARGGLANWSRNFERDGFVKRATSTNGNDFGVSPLSIPEDVSFRTLYLPLANVFTSDASSADPFTIERAIKHARCVEPLLAGDLDGDPWPVIRLAPEYGAFTQRLRELAFAQAQDYHGLWHVRLEGRYYGAI